MSGEPLAQWQGRHVLGFQDCILKGILEADVSAKGIRHRRPTFWSVGPSAGSTRVKLNSIVMG